MRTLWEIIRGKDKEAGITWFGLLMGIFLASAVFGFLYETIFYCINDHMLLRRGSTFLPVIQLYGWGGLLIFLVAYDVRRHPWKVLLNSGVVCGLLEFGTGYVLHHVYGVRSWDYNTEIWNWGNIGGYVCFRSVVFFAVSGLLLIYGIIPMLNRLMKRMGRKRFIKVIGVITAVVMADIIYNDIFANYFHLPKAPEFYAKLGWPHKETRYN